MLDIRDLPSQVEPIVREAGTILLSYFQKPLSFKQKKDNDIVTPADLASEKYLVEKLKSLIPEAAFFVEEAGQIGMNDYCWVIDPLDGTRNFFHGLAYFSISIALTYKNEPVFGLIFHPILNELFYACKGHGAFLNGKQIQVSTAESLDQAFCLVGFPHKKMTTTFEVLQEIWPQIGAFRHLGSIALDQVNIACGRADALFFEKLSWWDIAAGSLIIKEAGGALTTYEGRPITSTYKSFVAANPMLHQELLTIFKRKAS
jgi:myo-inositol-1(or 4)-monophosphatase